MLHDRSLGKGRLRHALGLLPALATWKGKVDKKNGSLFKRHSHYTIKLVVLKANCPQAEVILLAEYVLSYTSGCDYCIVYFMVI
jgi:hypothetical protein